MSESQSLSSSSEKFGLAPGTVIHVGERLETISKIKLIEFDKDRYSERPIENIAELTTPKNETTVSWFSITGLHDVELIEQLGRHFAIHHLVLEDIVNTHQRPKVEAFDDMIFIVLRVIRFDPESLSFDNEQFSLILGSHFILTFEESESDLLNPILRRIQNSRGKFRTQGPDYLCYSIIDLIVDHYFLIEDSLDEIVEILEDELLISPTPDMLNTIQKLKRGIIFVRRAVSPLREVLNGLLRSESDLIRDTTKVYLRDVYDHTIRVAEGLDTYRDLIAGLLEIYLSSLSNKMNEVMKVLTVFATIFIPLTFLAGVYGMNFEHIPELKWEWSYPAFWSVSLATAIGLLIFFRRKKWL